MQVDIRQQRRDHRSLWSPYLCLRPVPFLGYSRPLPFSDQAEYPSVGNAVLDELNRPLVAHVVKEPSNVRIEHPVHLLPPDAYPERIQRLMLTSPRAEPI